MKDKVRLLKIGLCLGLLAVSINAWSIIRKDGVSDSDYLNLGSNFPQIARFELSQANRTSGTLIASQWVITAAHAAGFIGGTVTIAGNSYTTTEWYFHPSSDLALTKLDRPVENVSPMRLHEQQDEDQQLCYFAGYGATGTGKTGQTMNDFTLRAGTNTCEVEPLLPTILWTDFDNGTVAANTLFDVCNSSPIPTSMECHVGNGDSGGAMIINDGSGPTLAGVISSTAGRVYGAQCACVRLSAPVNVDWIRSVIGVTSVVRGNVMLAHWSQPFSTQPISVEVHPTHSSEVLQSFVTYLGDGGQLGFPTTLVGTFDMYVKSTHWLRKRVVLNISTAGVGTFDDMTLVNGDVDGNNTVNVLDYAIMSDTFLSITGDARYNPVADLDGNGEVNIVDYSLYSDSLGAVGD